MKQDEADIIVEDEQEYVITEDGKFGLGLHFPEVKTQEFPTLATSRDLLSREQIIAVVESSEFAFGREHFDDSYLTNQNGYGSCAGYAAASALTKARVARGQKRVDLSGDYAYSLVNRGRDNGSGLANNMRAMVKNGYASKETVPLGGIYPRKYNKAKADAEARRFRAHEPYALPDEQSFATALALRIPVVHAIHVGRNWRRLDGDVLIGNKGVGNHSEHCDDIRYNRSQGRFEFRNGSSHKRPYFWITWGDHLASTSRHHQFYAVPSAIDDPQGDNPEGGGDRQPEPVQAARLTVQSSSGCIWCDRWDSREKHKVQEAGIEINSGSVAGGGGVPRFMLEVNGQSKIHVGYWSADDIEMAVASMEG